METVRFRIFSLSREIQVEQNTKRFLKSGIFFKNHNSTIIAKVGFSFTCKRLPFKDEGNEYSPSGRYPIAQRNDAI